MKTLNRAHRNETYNPPSTRILRLPEVISRTGLSRATIYARITTGNFPKQIHLGPRTVGWLSTDVAEWVNECISASRPNGNGGEG